MKVSRPAARRPWTAEEVAQLGEMLEAGKQPADVAAALDRTRQSVYARLQKLYQRRARNLRSGQK